MLPTGSRQDVFSMDAQLGVEERGVLIEVKWIEWRSKEGGERRGEDNIIIIIIIVPMMTIIII